MRTFYLCVIFILFSTTIVAQTPTSQPVITPSYTFPVDQFPNPSFNFDIPIQRIQARDVNNDGIMDYYQFVYAFDERTTDPSDKLWKTIYWFGKESPTLEPDSLVYHPQVSIGDINNDNLTDFLELTELEFIKLDRIGTIVTSSNDTLTIPITYVNAHAGQYLTDIHLDSDQYQDFISFNHQNTNDTERYADIHVVWGGSTLDSSNYRLYSLFDADSLVRNSGTHTLKTFDFDKDGREEIIAVGRSTEGNFLAVYAFNNNRDLVLIQKLIHSYPILTSNYRVSFFSDTASNTISFSSNGFTTDLFLTSDISSPIQTDSASINLTETLLPIGDFDGNGNTDYLAISGEVIVSLVERDEQNQSVNQLSFNAFSQPKIDINYLFNIASVDLNEDGFNDLVFYTDNFSRSTFVLYGNEDRSLNQLVELTSELYFNDRSFVESTFNLGDIDEDGSEDFAILSTNFFDTSTIDIYLGGKSEFLAPDITVFEKDTVQKITFPAIGDFDGDEVNELVFFYQTSSSILQFIPNRSIFTYVDFDENLDYQITEYIASEIISELTPEAPHPAYVFLGNVGDLNLDGADELAISVRNKKTNLFFGGDNKQTGDTLQVSFRSTSMIALNDINENGKPDFALSDSDHNEDGIQKKGQVRIYEFDDANSTLTNSFYKIGNIQNDSDQYLTNNIGSSITAGDFNGDTKDDLAILAINHSLYSLNEAIYIYYGGRDFDTVTPNDKVFIEAKHNYLIDEEIGFTGNSFGIELQAINDINQDGADELLYYPKHERVFNHALLFKGVPSDTIDHTDPIIFKSMNTELNMGGKNIAVGSFNTSEGIDFLFHQRNDQNNLSDPVYIYELPYKLVSSIENRPLDKVSEFGLAQNYPNPFNPSTNIQFTIPSASTVSLVVYDILGREVAELVNETLEAGYHTKRFDGSALASGIYVYKLSVNGASVIKKMLLVK